MIYQSFQNSLPDFRHTKRSDISWQVYTSSKSFSFSKTRWTRVKSWTYNQIDLKKIGPDFRHTKRSLGLLCQTFTGKCTQVPNPSASVKHVVEVDVTIYPEHGY